MLNFPIDSRFAVLAILLVASISISGCAALPSSGPSARVVKATASNGISGPANIQVIDVNEQVARRLIETHVDQPLADSLGDGIAFGSVVGRGDVLEISIWEAPPAVLFGASLSDSRSSIATSRPSSLPEIMVDQNGRIDVPFAGQLTVAGKTPSQISQAIAVRLAGKAHDPQIGVRVVRNASANVTVVGDVASSGRVGLTTKGERLLDVLASVGGVRQPVGKMTIQITRGDKVATEALADVIKNPRENIRLQADDVVTALFQPFSFIVLGATKKNEEIPFEATGLTLAQALGRVGGLDDQRADARGVFIFRLEDPKSLGLPSGTPVQVTAEGKVPIIYRVDMKNPATFFVAQSFPVRDKDVVYVSNAPVAEFQKFVNAISGTILPFATVAAVIP